MEVNDPSAKYLAAQSGNPKGLLSGWVVQPLSEFVVFLDGMRRPVKESDRASMRGNIPYYGASGVVDYVDEHIFDEELVLLSEDGENIVSRNLPLAFRITGKAWVNNHAHVLRPKPGVDARFLAELLESLNYEQFNSGTAQPKLNKRTVANLALTAPSALDEQRLIADALTDADALIDSLEQLLAKKRQIKQGAMQELLTGKRRLCSFTGNWSICRIGEIAAKQANSTVGGPFGSDLVAKDYVSSGVPVIRGQNMGRRFVAGDFAFVTKEKAKTLQANMAKPLDLIFTQRGTLGQVSLVPDAPFNEYLISQSQMKLTVDGAIADPIYIYHYFASEFGQQQILDSSIQTGVPHTNLGILRDYKVPLPQLEEQRAIAGVISDMEADIAAVEARLTKARDLKQAMAQALLTGRVRLVEGAA